MKIANKDKFLAVLLACYMAILPSCNKKDDPAGSGDTPPQIPPIETMQMNAADLSLFSQPNSKGSPVRSTSRLNWSFAALIVNTWNLVVFLGLAIPVTATAAAFNQTPTLESDAKFHWRYSVNGASVELTGQIRTSDIKWEMYVSGTTLSLDNFLWYDGETAIGGETGTWRFYNPVEANRGDDLAQIDWQHTSENERTLQFSNTNQSLNDGFGDALTYQVAGDSVSVTFSDASSGDDTRIAWNRQTKEGYLLAPNYRQGQRSCWDSQLNDVDCQ